MDIREAALSIALELIRKSGVREWVDGAARESIWEAAIEGALALWGDSVPPPPPETSMSLPDTFRMQTGTTKTFKSSGGDAVITMTSVSNAAARQSDKLDFGATRAARYLVRAAVELAATPTAGNTIDLYLAPSSSATAGTDNPGNVTGADAAYTGYSSNLAASVKQLQYIGSLIVTAQATATVQNGVVGICTVPQRYGSLVVDNESGAAFHSSATNVKFEFIPLEDVVED